MSSSLAQDTSDSWLRRDPEVRIRPVYFRGPNFGWLSFAFYGDVPALRFELRDAAGRTVPKPLMLCADERVNGVSSWRRHIDADLLRVYDERY